MSSNTTIYVIGLCFGQEHVDAMLAVADTFCATNFPQCNIVRIVVDNKISNDYENATSKNIVISGDNSYFEFSGWQRGLDYAKSRYACSPNDVCILINDTIHRRSYSTGGDRFFEDFVIKKPSSEWPQKWAAGYIDDFPTPTSILGLHFSTWIRSNFVVFNWECIQFITPLLFPFSDDTLFSEHLADGFWKADAPLSDNWKAYIACWLFGEESSKFPEYRLNWLHCQPLSHANHAIFRRKAVCILSEHYLTARLLHENVDIFDFNIYPKLPDRHIVPYYK